MINMPQIDPKLLQALIQQEQGGTMLNQPQQQPVNLQPATPTPKQVDVGGMLDIPQVQQTQNLIQGSVMPEEPKDLAPMLPPTNPETPPQGVMVSGEGYAMNNLETLASANNSLLPEGEKFGFETSWTGQNDTYGGPGMSANQEWVDSIDYSAGANGKTIGQVTGSGGDIDPWGRPVQWSEGDVVEGAKLGQIVDTPAGKYLIVNGADGQLALKGLEGAMHGGGQYFFNMSKKGHHVGINPLTGDVWYQSAPSVQEIPGADYWSSVAWDPNVREQVRNGELPIPTEVRGADPAGMFGTNGSQTSWQDLLDPNNTVLNGLFGGRG